MQDVITRCIGWVTQYNPLSTGSGALIKADNCAIRRENIVENRRGYSVYASLTAPLLKLMTYLKRTVIHDGTVLSYDNGSGTYLSYSGAYNAPSGYKMRYVEANSNLYLTSDVGVQVITDIAGTAARKAGMPRALDPSYVLNAAGTGFLSNTSQCAYRVTYQRTDANKNVITGYPSQRLWAINGSGTAKNIDVTIYFTSEIVAGDVIQVWRSAQQAGVTSDLAGDELGLIYQYTLSSADVVTGSVTFTDNIVDALIGQSLYTSPSQQGIGQANDRPPLCKDMALYKSAFLCYANCQTKQRLYFTMVGVTGLSGKTITLGGVTYNFGATELLSGGGSPQVKVTTASLDAVNIQLTAQSLVRVINRYAGNTSVYAYYQSGPNDLPGAILIEERGIGGSAFTLNASDATVAAMFSPQLPISPTTTSRFTSSNSVQKNALYVAKYQEFEHVPALNYFLVGPSNAEIQRIFALRDSLIIVTDQGIYRMTGDSFNSLTITTLDLTIVCKSPNSIAVLSNQGFMLSNQGVVAISDTSVEVVSRDIEPNILPLLGLASISALTTGVAYESERSYYLSTMTSAADVAATQTFVFNIFTRTWVRHTYGFSDGVVEQSADKLYFGKASDSNVYRERKNFDDTDYADPEQSITISAISGLNVTFTIAGAVPQVGWAILQNSTDILISAISSSGSSYTATMLTDMLPASWVTGPASIFPNVGMEVEWDAWTGQGGTGMLKQVREVQYKSDNTPGVSNPSSLTATIRTNFDDNQDQIVMTTGGSRWGSGPWGTMAWGGGGDSYSMRTYVPMNKQYCEIMNAGFKHANARERLAIAGIVFVFESASERVGK